MDIYSEIQDRLDTKKFIKTQKCSGGCICDGTAFETDNGIVFVKLNSDDIALTMFSGELMSLKKLKETETIRIPEPYFIIADPKNNGGALVMEYLDMKPVDNWAKLGSDLADLHLFNSVLGKKKKRLESWIGKPPKSELPDVDITMKKEIKINISDELVEKIDYVDEFGFETMTCCGKIPQNNEWHDNWIEFFARNKLGQQIDMIIENYNDRKVLEYWSELQLKVDKFFTDISQPIEPSLLHGDLWSGNVRQVDDQPVIFDPASFYGHSEYDLAISKLFGGFNTKFFQEYFKKIPQQKGFQKRGDLYTLFHLLNHWNHFGGSYQNESLQMMKKLIK